MKKFLILILGLSFIAASCDLGGVIDLGGGGARGMLKSEDNGETFRTANTLTKGNISGITVNSLVFDPSNPDTLYIGASAGIYKSDDAAKTWRYILSGISVAGLAVDPYVSSTLYAAGIANSNGKIIKSLDGGTSWVDVYTEPSKNNTVLAIGVSRSNPSLVVAGLNTGEIIRSQDGGHTWQATKDLADKIIDIKVANNNSIYALTARKGLYESRDSGASWNSVTSSLANQTLSQAGQAVSSVTNFYDLALDQRQSGVLYLGTEQGLLRSVNDGGSWTFLALPVKNAAQHVSAAGVDPSNSNNIYAAIASTIFKSSNGGLTWETKVLPTSASVRSILINPQSHNIIYLGMGA